VFAGAPIDLVRGTIIPLLQAAYDAASEVSGQIAPMAMRSVMPEQEELKRAGR
jgi:hypothetical protein